LRLRGALVVLLLVGLVSLHLFLVTADPAAADDFVFAAETDSGTADVPVVVSLSVAMEKTARVRYSTEDGTAIGGEDYVPTSGTAVFQPGETRQVVNVRIIGDRHAEGDEFFFFTTEGSRATITIVDDDPLIAISSNTVMEGDDGVHDMAFVVTLSVPAATAPGAGIGTTTTTAPPTPPPGGRFRRAVEVSFSTSDGTALAGQDYVPTGGQIVFDPGETSTVITVPIIGDLIPERDETFFVALSDPSRGEITTALAQGTIVNDDAAAFTGQPPTGFDFPGGPVPPGARPSVSGVRSVTSSGEVVAFGDAAPFGSAAAFKPNQPMVGVATTPSRNGYWLVASDGGVFSFGDARFFGSTGGIRLNQPVVGMATTPTGDGYWLVAADGGIFAFGDAPFLGSTAGVDTVRPIVGMTVTPSGKGYWLVTSHGGVFSFGDARFFGSTGGRPLNKPVVGMAATPSGDGYWLVTSDGGVFSFGDAKFFGSTGGIRLNQPVVGMAATPTGNGYWLIASDGGLFTFGDAPFFPRRQELPAGVPVVGMALGPAIS
jgi:urease beta subunit